ncbi:hypothetical protein B0H16DRAFT_1466794 [Mycena metata]|uniref:Uncharacterized protein n=1 Tax=Mycena metata TaxID=1033252 RepID=A0AAD7MX92_9AGAR|nr:hypothetical protein B0H16DRAFT_1466794 [Mycena metata]
MTVTMVSFSNINCRLVECDGIGVRFFDLPRCDHIEYGILRVSGVLLQSKLKADKADTYTPIKRESKLELLPELKTIEDCLHQSTATTKELREQRKAVKLASGVKKTKWTGEKAREILPNADKFAGFSNTKNIQSSPVRPALHLCDNTTQVQANLEVEVEAGLELLFPTQYSTPYLEPF